MCKPVDSAAADKRLTSNVLDHKLRVISQLPKHGRMGSTLSIYRLDRFRLCIQHCQDVNVRPCTVVGPPLCSNVIHGEADSDRRKL